MAIWYEIPFLIKFISQLNPILIIPQKTKKNKKTTSFSVRFRRVLKRDAAGWSQVSRARRSIESQLSFSHIVLGDGQSRERDLVTVWEPFFFFS